jgi:hypothetical protein
MDEKEREKVRDRYARREERKRLEGRLTASQIHAVKVARMRDEDPVAYAEYRRKQNDARVRRMQDPLYHEYQSLLRKKANLKRQQNPGFLEKAGQYRLTSYVKLKMQTIEAYGGKCILCGQNIPEFLTIDHSLGDGNVDRKRGFSYRELRRLGFPKDKGLRVLCWNCNCSMGAFGYVPQNLKDSLIWQRWNGGRA